MTEKVARSEIRLYRGERVRVEEVIGGLAYIWIPSRQEAVWVHPGELEEVRDAGRD